jgi:predicted DNA-binding transcriptional regulator AlpA
MTTAPTADARVRRSRPNLNEHQEQTARFSTGERLVTMEELGDLLGLAPGTIRWMQHEGKLPVSVKLGRRRVWREADVLAWLDELFREAEISEGLAA